MDLQTYQAEAVKTIKWRGTDQLDCDHMIVGMFSEIHEMIDALKPMVQPPRTRQEGFDVGARPILDWVNIKEELGDKSWYVVNYATIRKISISQQTDVGVFGLQEYVYLSSKLSDLVKKWMIYNKEMVQEIRNEEIILVQKLMNCLCNFSPTMESSDLLDINEVWQMNIDKLHKKRYKNAQYSDDQANNRNVEEERKTLEGK